ncbi:MAG: hypothetical protein WCS43_13345, partial [Verrucomicrobiota bacterium]
FIQGRLGELLILMTVAVALWMIGTRIDHMLRSRGGWQRARGLLMGFAVFILLNIFVAFSGRTVLFCSVFFNKSQVDNIAHSTIKRVLMTEIGVPRRAILIGNSQTNRSIDEVRMNDMIGKRLWTTELTQPGAHSFDLLALTRDMPVARGDIVICYLSEVFFFGSGRGGVASDFFGFREIPDLVQLGGWDWYAPGSIRSGLIGQVLPIYHYRNSISQKALGWHLANVGQARFDASLEQDLESQAERRAPELKAGKNFEFEKAAFTRMARELSGRECGMLLIAGHLHPAMQRRMDPGLRKSMRDFLDHLQETSGGSVTVVDGARFFEPAAGDFRDLVHFTDDAQRRFTCGLVEFLQSSGITSSASYPRDSNQHQIPFAP